MLLCYLSGIALLLDCLSVPYHKAEAPKNVRPNNLFLNTEFSSHSRDFARKLTFWVDHF